MTQTVLVVEDDAALAEALKDTLELAGYEAFAANDGKQALAVLDDSEVSLVVSDVHMQGMDGHALLRRVKDRFPDLPVLLMTAYGSIPKAVEAMRDGAVDYLAKPFEAQALIGAVQRWARAEQGADEEPVAVDPRSRELLALAERVARAEATVMLLGESGTGKEVLARYIHHHSLRADGPFVAINCAAIPDNMLEATLFGYEKGAFTGAYKTTPGKFEQAQGGTLLLDEISEMDLGLQAKLLRVLQEREVERLGGGGLIELDVRVLATSNRDMAGEVAAGRFREDLYYRLNVFPLQLPPLRERRDDIAPLAGRFLARMARSLGRPEPLLDEGARARLQAHDWPGNVRELDNLMQRALILQAGDRIGAADLHFEAPGAVSPVAVSTVAPAVAENLSDDLKTREQRLILDALRQGSRKAAAEKLGISQRTLRYKLARMRQDGVAIPEGVGA